MDSSQPRRGRLRLAFALAIACALTSASLAFADGFGPQPQITSQGPAGDLAYQAGFHATAYNSATRRHLVVYVGTTTVDPDPSKTTEDIWGQLADDDGNPVGGAFRISETSQAFENYNPAAVAYSPERNEFLAVWDIEHPGDNVVYVRRLAADGTPLGPETPISTDHEDIESETVVWNPSQGEYLVTWKTDAGDASDRIYGRRVAGDGTPLEADDKAVAGNDAIEANDAAHLVYNAARNEYLVVFRAYELDGGAAEIHGQRLDATATRIGTPDFRVSTMGADKDDNLAAYPPSVTWSSKADQYLVAWSGDETAGEREAYGQLLSGDGAEIGADDFRISDMGPEGSKTFRANRPRVTYNPNADEYLVVWNGDDDTPPLLDAEYEVFGQYLAASGAEVGTNDFRISSVGTDGDGSTANRPTVTYNPNTCDYFVTFFTGDADSDIPPHEWEVFGRRVSATACPPPPPAVDSTDPVISGIALSSRRIAVGKPARKAGASAGKAPRAITIRYRLSEASRVTFRVQRRTVGRRVAGRCRKTTKTNAKRRRCVRFVNVGRLAQSGKAGLNRKRFNGKVGGRKLKPGRYRFVITARDAAGNVSAPRRAAFRAVRR